MAAEFSRMIEVAAHAFPWVSVIYLMIRYLPRLALTVTHMIAITVALFHQAPERRKAARDVLDRHPFTRRRTSTTLARARRTKR